MPRTVATPKHVWFIAVVALLWNLMGAVDYLMTQTRNDAYLSRFDEAQLDYFFGFPVWVVFFWALAVWGGVIGSVLLLLRMRMAVPVFLVSLVSMVVTAVYNFGLSDGMAMMGAGGFAFTVAIFVVALGLWLYARAMRARSVLA